MRGGSSAALSQGALADDRSTHGALADELARVVSLDAEQELAAVDFESSARLTKVSPTGVGRRWRTQIS